jgi:hypothetical protein
MTVVTSLKAVSFGTFLELLVDEDGAGVLTGPADAGGPAAVARR